MLGLSLLAGLQLLYFHLSGNSAATTRNKAALGRIMDEPNSSGVMGQHDDEYLAHQNNRPPQNISSHMGEQQGIVKHRSMGGRLGNQLFEHAATLAIAKATGKQACIFGARVHLIHEHFLSDGAFLRKCDDGETTTDTQPHRVHHEAGYAIFSPLPKTEKSLEVIGYLQSWKYFAGSEAEILKAFTLKPSYLKHANEILDNKQGEEDGDFYYNVGIHMRWFEGDYLREPPKEYYQKAMQYFKLKYGNEGKRVRFYLASNDMKRSQNLGIFSDDESVVFLNNDGTTHAMMFDFAVLMSCDGMILSTGTFGWWAAWLGPHQRNEGDVLYFSEVFDMNHEANKGLVNKEDYYPPTWREIEVRDSSLTNATHQFIHHHPQEIVSSPTTFLPPSSPNFNCLRRFQSELNKIQQTELQSRIPILSSIVPTQSGIEIVFIMKHIPDDQYISWYQEVWYCSSTTSAVMLGRDPHFHTLSIICPSSTQLIEVRDAQYTIPSNICPWTLQPAHVSACTMVKGPVAQAQLPAWIAYHRVIGIEQFYVYVNEEMKEPPFQHDSVHWIPFQDPFDKPYFVQQAMQNDCIARARFRSNWLALFDVDEYFQLMDGSSVISNTLEPFEDQTIGGIQIKNWFFGRHPEIEVDEHHLNPVFDRFIWRAPHAITSGREKVIVQPIHVVYFSVHKITLGERMHTMDAATEIRMNHYKMPTKGVWGYNERQGWSKLVRDDSMRVYVERVEHEIDSIVGGKRKNYRI